MGRDIDFEFGANTIGSIADDLSDCYGLVICNRCGKEYARCDVIREALREPERKSGMNVSGYIGGQQTGERLPFIDAKHVGASAKVKILAVREVKTPSRAKTKDKPASNGFDGLFMEVKNGDGKKYIKSLSFKNAIDLGNVVAQTGSEDTDDWIGETITLVTKKGTKGRKFVNVAPATKKRGKK